MANTERSAQYTQYRLLQGQILPAFSLPGTDELLYSPWKYKQREHLLLLFPLQEKTDERDLLLTTIARAYTDFRAERCTVLAVTPEDVSVNVELQRRLGLPFPLLSDLTGSAISHYTKWDTQSKEGKPCIVLADRYGAVYNQWVVENEEVLPPPAELLATLSYLNRLCTP